MENRKCTQCNKIKPESDYYKGQGWKCKECIKANSRAYKERNKEKRKKDQKKYYLKNKEKAKAYQKKYSEENAEKIKANRRAKKKNIKKYMKIYHAKRTEIASDAYIKSSLLKGFNNEDITPEMIETKRLLIFIKRELKQLENGKQESRKKH